MSDETNVVDFTQFAKAKFEKLFGDDTSMYIPATEAEKLIHREEYPEDYYIFIVPREKPVISERFLPKQLLEHKTFDFVAQPGEYFVFQVVVWAPECGLFQVSVSASETDNFVNAGNLRAGEIKSFWLGMDIPINCEGVLSKEIVVSTENMGDKAVGLDIKVAGEVLLDKGESDDKKMARLCWLNSDIGKEDTVFSPYIPLKRVGNTILWLGHTLILGQNGLPESVMSGVPEQPIQLLKAPIRMESEAGVFQGQLEFVKDSQTRVEWVSKGRIGEYTAELHGALEFDGYLEFSIKTKGSGNFKICIDCVNTEYMVGLGKHGGRTPKRMDWFWDKHAWQDGCWIGDIDGGIRLRLRDSKYKQPLVNCYYHFSELNLPEAWHNEGKGGISLRDGRLTAFSGNIVGEKSLEFGFDLQVTPFHSYDVEKHMKIHAWHPMIHEFEIGGTDPLEEVDFEELRREGINRVNIHHGIGLNPFINYPFTEFSIYRLKNFVERAHEHEIEVILYYTMREISIHPAEFWAFRAMGDEILQPGLGQDARPATNNNGPNSWFGENISSSYLAAWGEVIKNGPVCNNIDLAVVTVPESKRLENFFLEGLRYLLERCPIDGLYLDDISISRSGFQRLYRVFYQYRGKAPIIDFHAWNPYGFEIKDRDFGRCSVILRDMDKLPYFTELWLGEAVDYESAEPDYYLTEISGIPFGKLSQMLQNGGNPWRGILYGMTSRYGWQHGDPRNLWNYFEKFGLSGLKMEQDPIFPIDLPSGIRVTRFSNAENKCCYALASWETEPFVLDLGKNGFHAEKIPSFQDEGQCIINPGKGLILEEL